MSSDRSDESEQRLRHRTSVGYRSGLFIRKEMRETLRDRRTIITLLAMPLLLYPLLGMVFRFLAISQAKRTAAPEYVVAVSTDVEALWLTSSVEFGDRILKGRAARAAAAFSSIPGSSAESGAVDGTAGTGPGSDGSMTPDASQVSVTGASGGAAVQSGAQRSGPPGPSDNSPRLRIYSASDPAGMNLSEEIASGEADLGVQVELQNWTGTVQTMQPAAVRLITNRDSPLSREAQRYVEECLQAASTSIVLNQARQYDRSIRLPVRITRDAVDSSQKSRGFLGLLPLVLLLMTVTGGVYPAIDLTAGERERDTLETLIALPVPKVHLLLAKFVAVFTVTLLTGLVNILAMTATVYSLQMENQLFGEGGLSLRIALSLLFILTVFGLFYSAVLLALTSASRSFKEAQAYLIPLMLMSIAPGLVILLPGWHLDGWVAVVPLVNMLLLARDVFEGTARTVPAMIAIISTLAYASCALTLAARIFGTDAIAVGSRGTWSDLFRRPAHGSSIAAPGTAMITLSLMFPLYFFASGVLNRTAGTSPSLRLLTGSALTIFLFGLFPLGIAQFQRLSMVGTWQFRKPPLWIWPAALLIGLGTWPWIYELVLMTRQFGLAGLDAERLQQVTELLERWKAVPLVMMVVCLGVIPGVFEELFFRGFLLSSFRSFLRPWTSIVLCGVIFGVFHVIAAEGAAFERLLPSATLGCLLSWIAVRTGSVLPGMLAHVTHNSSLLSIAHFREELSQLTTGTGCQEHLPMLWLAVSALSITAGIIGIYLVTVPAAEKPE